MLERLAVGVGDRVNGWARWGGAWFEFGYSRSRDVRCCITALLCVIMRGVPAVVQNDSGRRAAAMGTMLHIHK